MKGFRYCSNQGLFSSVMRVFVNFQKQNFIHPNHKPLKKWVGSKWQEIYLHSAVRLLKRFIHDKGRSGK